MSVVLVTGADRGIGREMVRQLHERGDEVIAMCLEDGSDLAEMGVRVEANIDVTSHDQVTEMAERLRDDEVSLDWLVNNAGVLGVDELGSIDYEDVRRQFEINTVGPLRVTEALLDLLHEGSKVSITTSRVGSLGDNSSGKMYAYRMSKAAANMVGLNLHHDLHPRGIAVIMLHPGMVATDLTKDYPGDFDYIQPSEAASGLIRNLDELTLETSGRFRHSNGEYLPW